MEFDVNQAVASNYSTAGGGGLYQKAGTYVDSSVPGIATMARYIQEACSRVNHRADTAARLLSIVVESALTTPSPSDMASIGATLWQDMFRVDPLTLKPIIDSFRSIIHGATQAELSALDHEFQAMMDIVKQHQQQMKSNGTQAISETEYDDEMFWTMTRDYCKSVVACHVLTAAALSSNEFMSAHGHEIGRAIGAYSVHCCTVFSKVFNCNILSAFITAACNINSGLGEQTRSALIGGFQHGATARGVSELTVLAVAHELLSQKSTSTMSFRTWVCGYLNEFIRTRSPPTESQLWYASINLTCQYFSSYPHYYNQPSALTDSDVYLVDFLLRALQQHHDTHYIFARIAECLSCSHSPLHSYVANFLSYFHLPHHYNNVREAQFSRMTFLTSVTLNTSLLDSPGSYSECLHSIPFIPPTEMSTFTVTQLQELIHQLCSKSSAHRAITGNHFLSCILSTLSNPSSIDYSSNLTNFSISEHHANIIKQSLQLLPSVVNLNNVSTVASSLHDLGDTVSQYYSTFAVGLLDVLNKPDCSHSQRIALLNVIRSTAPLSLFNDQTLQHDLVQTLAQQSNLTSTEHSVSLAATTALLNLFKHGRLSLLDVSDRMVIIQAAVGNIAHLNNADNHLASATLNLLTAAGLPSPSSLSRRNLPTIQPSGVDDELVVAAIIQHSVPSDSRVGLMVSLSTALALLRAIGSPLPHLHIGLSFCEFIASAIDSLQAAFSASTNPVEHAAIIQTGVAIQSVLDRNMVSADVTQQLDRLVSQSTLHSASQQQQQQQQQRHMMLIDWTKFWLHLGRRVQDLRHANSDQITNFFHIVASFFIRHSPISAVFDCFISHPAASAFLYHIFPVASLALSEYGSEAFAPAVTRTSSVCTLVKGLVSAQNCQSLAASACIRYCQLVLHFDSPTACFARPQLPLEFAAAAALRHGLVTSEIDLRQAISRMPQHTVPHNDVLLLAAEARNGKVASRQALSDYIMQLPESADHDIVLCVLDALDPTDDAFEAVVRSVLADIVAYPALFPQPPEGQHQQQWQHPIPNSPLLFHIPTPPELGLTEEHFSVAVRCLNRRGHFDATRALMRRMLPWFHMRLRSEVLFDCALAALDVRDYSTAQAIVRFQPVTNLHAAVINGVLALASNDFTVIPEILRAAREAVTTRLRTIGTFDYAGSYQILQLLSFLHEIEESAQEPPSSNLSQLRLARDICTQPDQYHLQILRIIRTARSA